MCTLNAISLMGGGGIAERLKCSRVVVCRPTINTDWLALKQRHVPVADGDFVRSRAFSDTMEIDIIIIMCRLTGYETSCQLYAPLEACQVCLVFLAATVYTADSEPSRSMLRGRDTVMGQTERRTDRQGGIEQRCDPSSGGSRRSY